MHQFFPVVIVKMKFRYTGGITYRKKLVISHATYLYANRSFESASGFICRYTYVNRR
jgi:hypothetical protein